MLMTVQDVQYKRTLMLMTVQDVQYKRTLMLMTVQDVQQTLSGDALVKQQSDGQFINNNNNGYFGRLTRTGPKRLHIR